GRARSEQVGSRENHRGHRKTGKQLTTEGTGEAGRQATHRGTETQRLHRERSKEIRSRKEVRRRQKTKTNHSDFFLSFCLSLCFPLCLCVSVVSPLLLCPLWFVSVCLEPLDRQGEAEGAAHADFGLDPDFTSVAFDDLLADGQSDACARVT